MLSAKLGTDDAGAALLAATTVERASAEEGQKNHTDDRRINWLSLIFWLFLALSVVLFYARQASESKSVQGMRDSALNLGRDVDTVREAVFTLPPKSFLMGFSREIANIHTKLLSGTPRQTVLNKDELADFVCTLLITVAVLAQGYDEGRPARYAANVRWSRMPRRATKASSSFSFHSAFLG
jgi:hypothetical protein